MMGKTHVLFAMSCYAPLVMTQAIPASGASIMILMLGALLPDVDHEKSMLGGIIWPLSIIIGKLSPHRGATHSLLCLSFVGYLALKYLSADMAIALIVGYGSHLLGDLFFGKGGCPLWWPFGKKTRLKMARLTGSVAEMRARWLLLLWLVAIVAMTYRLDVAHFLEDSRNKIAHGFSQAQALQVLNHR